MRQSLIAIVAAGLLAAGCSTPAADRDVLFQTATISALLEGLYDGNMTLADLAKRGDLGIGTFDGLDGELILLGGEFYRVRADGRVYRPDPAETTTPFASVTFFDADLAATVAGPLDLAHLEALMDKTLADAGAGRNVPVAARITGTFTYMKTRSVPKQAKPYPRLVDVTAKQPTFEFRNVKGTIVGFRFPDFAQGVNVPGWHLHFLNADETGGGHILELETAKVRVEMDRTPTLTIFVPQGGAFAGADLSKNKPDELRRAEK